MPQPTPTPTVPATPMPRLRAALPWLLMLALLLSSIAVQAQTRAWLDRDRVGSGETVTLNIETPGGAAPDYTPLRQDFAISGNTSSRRFEMVNGRTSSRTLYAVALRPLREGVLTVPSLTVGSARTQPMSLVVTPAQARIPARSGDDVFIESEADDRDPYVQQAVGWVVRLYSAVPLVSGQLDQPAPDGASLQQVGDDAQYSRQIDGRRYQVVERRYLLIPERSGTLTIPGAGFEGRGAAGFFDDFFGSTPGALRAQAPPRFLQVRPVPADAPQPWLPLHDLQLRYQSTPQGLRQGAAATLTIEATADGANAAQMPDLQLPAVDGAQVFAEPVQVEERFVDGRPRVKLTRQFSLVPTRAGEVELPGMQLGWWNVRGGAAQTASLPPLKWTVAPGAVAGAPAAAVSRDSGAGSAMGTTPVPEIHSSQRWVLAALLFAALWLFTLVWGLQRRAGTTQPGAVTAGTPSEGRHLGTIDRAAFKRLLDTGDFGDVGDALMAMAHPPAHDLDEVRERLEDAAQREALDTMQQARWGDGDGVVARAQLREAFAGGPRWRSAPTAKPAPLPPLYPAG